MSGSPSGAAGVIVLTWDLPATVSVLGDAGEEREACLARLRARGWRVAPLPPNVTALLKGQHSEVRRQARLWLAARADFPQTPLAVVGQTSQIVSQSEGQGSHRGPEHERAH